MKYLFLPMLFLLCFLLVAASAPAQPADHQASINVDQTFYVSSGDVLHQMKVPQDHLYVFKTRGVPPHQFVLIYNADQTKVLERIQVDPIDRDVVTSDAVLDFEMSPDGIPVLKKWFFANETRGVEFPYRPEIITPGRDVR